MNSIPQKIPAHEMVYRNIRDQILYGDLPPGQPITIQGLVENLEVSMTPVREAIRRLTAEGALEFQGNRRVCVPQMGERRFAELVFARHHLEPKLAELASINMNGQYAHKLKAIDLQLDEAIATGDVQGYMRHNHRFHFALYAQSNSRVLLPMAKTLWLRYGPLSRIICGQTGTQNLADHHEEAMDSIARQDHKATANAIRTDIEQGFEIVRNSTGWSGI